MIKNELELEQTKTVRRQHYHSLFQFYFDAAAASSIAVCIYRLAFEYSIRNAYIFICLHQIHRNEVVNSV